LNVFMKYHMVVFEHSDAGGNGRFYNLRDDLRDSLCVSFVESRALVFNDPTNAVVHRTYSPKGFSRSLPVPDAPLTLFGPQSTELVTPRLIRYRHYVEALTFLSEVFSSGSALLRADVEIPPPLRQQLSSQELVNANTNANADAATAPSTRWFTLQQLHDLRVVDDPTGVIFPLFDLGESGIPHATHNVVLWDDRHGCCIDTFRHLEKMRDFVFENERRLGGIRLGTSESGYLIPAGILNSFIHYLAWSQNKLQNFDAALHQLTMDKALMEYISHGIYAPRQTGLHSIARHEECYDSLHVYLGAKVNSPVPGWQMLDLNPQSGLRPTGISGWYIVAPVSVLLCLMVCIVVTIKRGEADQDHKD